ncbi:response regulator [Vibrio sp. S4M6]|uniref:response regulator n=1 Tax=Vibrio sinus TaxID=2946865 RepID=UPI002029B91C|nr:response regulator [Vibrio sinus]MCL9782260.1 response regulator [Vibrio sinus]
MTQRALVVDDDRYIRQYVLALLEGEFGDQLSISTCCNGKEALECLASQSYNLVITDVMMPEMDGYQLIERIRLNHDLPTIAISAGFRNADPQSVLNMADSLGADAIVSKEYLGQDLVNTARLFLG